MPKTKAPEPTDTGQEEVTLSARQQSVLQAGLHTLAISPVSSDFNQRLLAALAARDLRPWHAQLGTRLRWMLPTVLIGCSVTLALAYGQNLTQRSRNTLPISRAIAPMAAPPMPPLPSHFVFFTDTAPPATTTIKKGVPDEAR